MRDDNLANNGEIFLCSGSLIAIIALSPCEYGTIYLRTVIRKDNTVGRPTKNDFRIGSRNDFSGCAGGIAVFLIAIICRHPNLAKRGG